jgi:hypothetical protein
MKKIIPLIIFCLVIASCKSLFPNEKKLNYTAPVKMGDNWTALKPSLGKPDIAGDNFSSYFKLGMVVYSSADGATVTGLVFTWFKGGTHFTGEIYGIKIGDTYPKVTRLWGEPVSVGGRNDDYYEKTWKFKKFNIAVEFWATAGDDEALGGHYEAETVKRIQITSPAK